MNKIWFYIKIYAQRIWFRCLVYCILALSAFAVGPYFERFVPDEFQSIVSKDALAEILKILASSMLAVSIFSLSIIVQAFCTAATTASPRATELMLQNAPAHNAIGTFLGSFLFSIVGLIGVYSSYYNDKVVSILFIFTLLMIGIIVVVLLSWIDQVSKLGRIKISIDLVEHALLDSIRLRAQHPCLSCRPYIVHSIEPKAATSVFIDRVGFVQYIDLFALDELAQKKEVSFIINANPGTFNDFTEPMVWSEQELDDETINQIEDHFVIADRRTFSQDPRYGFVVLTEIGLRAMSPGINDPGTAIDVLGAQLRAIRLWVTTTQQAQSKDEKPTELKYKRLYMSPIQGEDVLEDMFAQLVIDASNNQIVATRLRKVLTAIQHYDSALFSPGAQLWLDMLDARLAQHFAQPQRERIMGLSPK